MADEIKCEEAFGRIRAIGAKADATPSSPCLVLIHHWVAKVPATWRRRYVLAHRPLGSGL
jgi:hypothetical protein